MNLNKSFTQYLKLSKSDEILRRYFVVNGFDGALTMLGLILGFSLADNANLDVALDVCLAAAIALAVSGVSSAYVSESAERHRSLLRLEQSMLTDLSESTHAQAATWTPWLVAAVNGLSPLCVSMIILSPIWLAENGVDMPISPYHFAIALSLVLMFFFGLFLGKVAGQSWIKTGLRTLIVGLLTISLIYLFTG